jgi:predicted RNA-binding protein with TRAM domain
MSVLVAGSAIGTKRYMPRRLPERDTARRTKRPSRAKRQQKYQSIPLWKAPVKAGEELDVVIDDVGSRGDGIARVGGLLIFVPQAKVGERLRVKITTVGRKFAVAEKLKETGGENP